MSQVSERLKGAAGQGIRIRPAAPSDCAELLAMINEGDPFPFGDPQGRLAVYERSMIWVAESDGAIAGTISGGLKRVRAGGTVTWASNVVHLRVKPAWRRLGIANALIARNSQWLVEQGATVRLSQIAAHRAHRQSSIVSRYTQLGTVSYLAFRRTPDAALPPVPGVPEFIRVGESPAWQQRVQRTWDAQDLVPAQLLDTIYKPRTEGGYLGTVSVRTAAGEAWGSLWDRHTAMRRRPLATSDRTMHLFDVVAPDVPAIRALILAAFAQLPQFGRLVFVSARTFDPTAIAALAGNTFTAELDVEDLLLHSGTVRGVPYLDIRD